MAYTLIWSDDAQEDIRAIISYLLDFWSDDVAERFQIDLLRLAVKLSKCPTQAGGIDNCQPFGSYVFSLTIRCSILSSN